jgi:peptide/nickel transport system permease protein
MRRYVVRRVIQSIFILIGISMLSFLLMHIAPGGPVQFFENPRVSPAQIKALQHSLGLDAPLPVQYGRWVWSMLHLDFGHSYVSRRPVLNMILERLPATVELSGASLILGFLGGIPLGLYAALKRGSFFDNLVRILTVALNSIPTWWLALILIIVFAIYLPILPSGGIYTLGHDTLPDRLWHLILPVTISATGLWLTLLQVLRSQVLEVLRAEYVTTARAKGLPNSLVLRRHVLRNAIIPVVTMMGGALAGLVSGSVLFETVFSWPGVGRLTYEAFYQRDYPLLMALFMISSFLVIFGNLLADIAYGFVDPRVKLE